MTRLLLAAACLALPAACAPTGAAGPQTTRGPERQCFSPDQVRNFRQGDVNQLYVRTGQNQVFELNAAGGCPDLDFANRLALVADGPGLAGGRLCVGDPAQVAVPGSTASIATCRVRVSRVLTAEEIAALPSRQRP